MFYEQKILFKKFGRKHDTGLSLENYSSHESELSCRDVENCKETLGHSNIPRNFFFALTGFLRSVEICAEVCAEISLVQANSQESITLVRPLKVLL